MRWHAYENNGSFEGYVGQDPKPIENKAGTSQCFLHVGQSPKFFDKKTQQWKKLRPIWMHFSVFGPLAEFVVEHIRTGMRVLVIYEAASRFHPRYKFTTCFEARRVRAIAEEFVRKDVSGRADAHDWRPANAKGGTRWPKVVPPPPDVEPPEIEEEDAVA